jgi:uncharacterized protein involved in exopolysaccharide biosynthesis
MNQPQTQEIHLNDYLQIIAKRKFMILGCLLMTIITVLIANYIITPVYVCTSRILIDERTRSSPITGVRMEGGDELQFIEYQTHFDLITSYPVLEKVYSTVFSKKKKKGPAKEKAIIPLKVKIKIFINKNFDTARKFIIGLIAPPEPIDPKMLNDPALWKANRIRKMRKFIEVEQVKQTRLVDLKASHENPMLAMKIANGFANAYIDYSRSSNFESTKSSIDWLSEQLESMKKEIRIAEKTFNDFKRKERIFSIKGKQQIEMQKIHSLTTTFSSTKSQRLAISAAIKELQSIMDEKKYDKVSLSIAENQLLENLHRELVNDEIELFGLKKTFKYRHPQIIAIENRIEQTKEQFEQELNRAISSLKSRYAVLEDKERTYLATIRQFESQALELNNKEMEYTMLEREAETNKKLYDLLFNNFTEANVIKAMPTTNIRLIEAAIYPLGAAKPQKFLNLILGTVLGLMIGLGLSFFLEYLDRTLNTPEDVVSYLELPLLSAVPKISTKKWFQNGSG